MPHSDAYDHLDPDCSDGEPTRKSFERLAFSILSLSRAIGRLGDETNNQAILNRIAEMETNLMLKLSEVKAIVAQARKDSSEAIGELANRIADLDKQIADLQVANSDPNVTDETFEADLASLKKDSAALAAIVGTPPPVVIPPTEPTE